MGLPKPKKGDIMSTAKIASDEAKTMRDLVTQKGEESFFPYHEGELVESEVVSVTSTKVTVDVGGMFMGIIPEKELSIAAKKLKPGDKVLSYILVLENDSGNAVLSLKRADKERYWKDLREKHEAGEVISILVKEANKGGLIVCFGDIEGFMPVSQLAPEHYPRVGNDRDQILSRLNKLIGQTLLAKVINFDVAGNKLIFSEKATSDAKIAEMIKDMKVSDVVTAEITGVVDFGLFVNCNGVEGLIHISEISWERVDDIKKNFKVGDKVEAQVISMENNRLSLSIKRLQPDPWISSVKKYKEGEVVEGEVTRVTPFGAFIKLDENVDALAHISELEETELAVGNKYKFKIVSIEPESHKMSLSIKALKAVKTETKK
jgi:small subunit ribosomal protein S1